MSPSFPPYSSASGHQHQVLGPVEDQHDHIRRDWPALVLLHLPADPLQASVSPPPRLETVDGQSGRDNDRQDQEEAEGRKRPKGRSTE